MFELIRQSADELIKLFWSLARIIMDNWEVSASDDEWNEYNPPDSAKNKNFSFIPERLAHLFMKIEEEKILKLTCHCPRVIAKNNEAQAANLTHSNLTPAQTDENNEHEGEQEPMEIQQNESNKSFEAFDFDTDDSEKPSIKRKTPGSAKRGKKEKVGSMSNVMNDLLRHKYLDELESTKKEEPNKEETKAK